MRKGIAVLAAIVLLLATLPAAAATRTDTSSSDFDPGVPEQSRRPFIPPVLPLTPKHDKSKPAPDKPLKPLDPIMTVSGEAVIGTSFTTNYNYDTQGDSVGNITTVMQTQVHGAAVCPPEPVPDTLTLDLNSVYPLSRTWTSGGAATPPAGVDYRWTFPVSAEGCGGFAAGETDQTATLRTGFTVSRAVDQRRFTGAGPFTQTLTVNITAEETFSQLRTNGHSDVAGLDATIQSISGGDYNIYPDGRGFDLWADNPTPGQQYTWQVTIRIESLPDGFQALDYMPDLQAGGFVTVTEGETPGSSVIGTSPGRSGEPLAHWSWQSGVDYRWQWRQVVGRLVHLGGSIRDPLIPEAQVWAGLETLYSYDSPTDLVDNPTVQMQAGVNTNLFNFPDGSGLAVVDPILDLSSAYPMKFTDSSGQPLPSPAGVAYRWGFADIPEGANGWANGLTDRTALLAPGFTASREADRRTFTEPGTQTLTLSVTPAEPMDRLQIQGRSEVNGFAALVRSVSGPGVNLHGDGRSFDAAVEAPAVGQTYIWTIETEIAELPAGFRALSYMPDIFVQNIDSVAEGVQDGSSLVRDTEFATWAWQAAGNYRWYWQQRLGRQTHLPGSVADPLGPKQVAVPVDIKPTSCPNPLNWTEKGVLPAAVLGTAGFDVSRVVPESVRLAGVAPLRWDLDDVATPYDGAISDPPDRMNCTVNGPDGLPDLSFKFDTQAVIAALGNLSDGDVAVLQLTGQLQDGTPITGGDVIWVVRHKR